jgi:hypothetical protein
MTDPGNAPVPTGIKGRCLCGAAQYVVSGPMGDILLCHCVECRRWHGHVSATVACQRADLELGDSRGLRWVQSPRSDAAARRGFCGECGSSLFWDSPEHATISVAAGTLDTPTGLRTASHWYVSQAGDYYAFPSDGLPHHPWSGEGELD